MLFLENIKYKYKRGGLDLQNISIHDIVIIRKTIYFIFFDKLFCNILIFRKKKKNELFRKSKKLYYSQHLV